MGMRLSEALLENLIICDLKARTKRSALCAIIRRLVESGSVTREQDLRDAVLGRERVQSTGIGRGIAVPHGMMKTAPDLVCAMGISRRGIKYGAIDNRPVHLMFLFINNKTRDVHYLSMLASVCRLFESEDFRMEVVSAKTPREVLALIRLAEVRECQFLANLPV